MISSRDGPQTVSKTKYSNIFLKIVENILHKICPVSHFFAESYVWVYVKKGKAISVTGLGGS
jgi:hypothetical protein